MSGSPETRVSLLVRLKDRRDQTAWYEFAEIYRPVVLRLAQRRGLHNLIVNALMRRPRERGTGDSAVAVKLHELPAPEGPASELVQFEYRRELFRWAARYQAGQCARRGARRAGTSVDSSSPLRT